MSSRLLSAIDKLRGVRTPDAAALSAPTPPPAPPVAPDIEAAVTAFLAELRDHPAFRCASPRHLEQPNGE